MPLPHLFGTLPAALRGAAFAAPRGVLFDARLILDEQAGTQFGERTGEQPRHVHL